MARVQRQPRLSFLALLLLGLLAALMVMRHCEAAREMLKEGEDSTPAEKAEEGIPPPDVAEAKKEGEGGEGSKAKEEAGKVGEKSEERVEEKGEGKGGEKSEEKGEEKSKEKGEEKSSEKGSSSSSDLQITPEAKKLKDIPPDQNCTAEVKAFCSGVTPGEQKVLECLVNQLKLEKAGDAPKDATPVSTDCKTEIRAFRVEMYKNIDMDKKMATVCKGDIAKYCDDDFLYPEPGNILACLRETKEVGKLTDGCKDEVLKAEEAAASDMKMDPQLNLICSSEAERLCKGVEPGEGRVQECLRSKRSVLAWDCQAELFRQEVEDADDIRLNVRLFKACLEDKKKFCPDVVPGDARVKDCLEGHRMQPDFSQQCKAEMVTMMERRARDFRLDPSLRKYCKLDIAEICYPDAEDISDVANWDSKVIECLQDYRDELKDPRCRQQVHQLTKRAAEDVQFDRPLAEACEADRVAYCKEVPEGHARVFMCLQDNRDKLKESCRSALFEQEVRYAEDIDFKFPMRQACTGEITRFCSNIEPGQGDVIKCLQEHEEDADMGNKCKEEVKKDEKSSATDYRLNYKLNKECFHDVEALCLHSCDKLLEAGNQMCGGTVLKCLSENSDKLKSKACKDEVFYFQKREVADIQLDVPLQQACKEDLERLCPSVSKDYSKTLSCLRNDRDALSPECKLEELRFSTMEASDIRLTPTLMNACGLELQHFCRGVPPGEGQAFRCLQVNVQEIGMGIACKAEVDLQTLRESSYYQLDTGLKMQCEADVAKLCEGVDEGREGHSLVLKCLVDHHSELAGPCQTEVSYLVRMALWLYHKKAPLTRSCDSHVDTLCANFTKGAVLPAEGAVVGVYGQCLTSAVSNITDAECQVLVSVVAVEGAHVGAVIDNDRLQETINKLTQLELATGQRIHAGSPRGLVLTGWIALAAATALTALLIGLGFLAYRHYYGPKQDYTLVVKEGDV